MKRELRQAFGLFLALLALVAPLTLAKAISASTALAEVTTFCRHDGGSGVSPGPTRPMPKCQHCPVCHGVSDPPGLVAAMPTMPRPGVIRVACATALRPAAAPPPALVAAALPRGPPSAA